MEKKLEAFLYDRLSNRVFARDHDKYIFLISYIVCIFTMLMHLALTIFLLVIQVWPLFSLGLFGILIDILLLRMVDKGKYLVFGLLFSACAMFFTLASAFYIGTNNLIIVYLLVTLLVQILIPYTRISVRAFVVFLLWACMIALIFINRYMPPIRDIGDANGILTLINMQVVFWGTVTQLTIRNTISNAIIRFNESELEKSLNDAHTDPLTGLYNRRYANTFFERLRSGQIEQLWCVAMLDIDNFKLLNDTHGHQAGDEVLVWLGDLIKTTLRKTDLVFRWGGEEFLILLKDVEVPIAFQILDKLRNRLESKTIASHVCDLKITVTIGVCQLLIDNVERSIDTCDRLMYEGKALGKNTVVM